MNSQKIKDIEESPKEKIDAIMHPLVREWFFNKFKDYSLTQRYGVKNIWDRKNILISAPTGGTKTLTAFLAILNYVVSLSEKKELEDKTYAVYTSPLKALSNDIAVNLVNPLEEIKLLAERKGIILQEIRVGLRTGDTSTKERAKMARKAPHILVTTPESLAIILTSPKSSEQLSALEFIIIDEIHAMTNKRGVYLSLTLERLSNLSVIDPVRIGLSATIAPIEEIAKFLVGRDRDCLIARVPLLKKIEIDMDYPGENILESGSQENQKELYNILDKIIQNNRTTLIFTNTRAATERIVHYLDLHFPGKYVGNIGAHHSSMSKDQRFMIEDRLRRGELKVVVSSTSLELGIDIGSIDIVVLLRSPKSVSRALQRIGRAGHKLHDNPKGKFIVMDRDDMIECGVMMKAMIEKKIDKIDIPKNSLDVLAQQIYGMAITKIWKVNEMLETIRKSYCYESLTSEDFYSVLSYLAGDYALEHRNVYGKIWYDPEKKEIGKKGKLARVIYMTNLGTIPQEGFIEVIIQSPVERRGQGIGKIDEAFLEKLKKGDVFTLGGQKYEFAFSRGMKAYVRANISRKVTIPSWFSETLPLSFDLGMEIGRFRRNVKDRIKNRKECEKFIQEYLYCKKDISKEIYDYFLEQEEFSEIPDERIILVEQFKEEKDFLLFHSVYGRRVNDVLARAYAFAAGRLKQRDVEIGINDNGFYLAGKSLELNKIISYVNSKNVELILKEAIEKTEVLKRRFRHCAGRSLMILRAYKGREKSVGRQQVHSGLLYSAVKKISEDFPILKEARREVMEDMMDLKNAKNILEEISKKKIKFEYKRIPFVSPFGLNLIVQGRADLLKMEDKNNFLKRMHELHLKTINNKKK